MGHAKDTMATLAKRYGMTYKPYCQGDIIATDDSLHGDFAKGACYGFSAMYLSCAANPKIGNFFELFSPKNMEKKVGQYSASAQFIMRAQEFQFDEFWVERKDSEWLVMVQRAKLMQLVRNFNAKTKEVASKLPKPKRDKNSPNPFTKGKYGNLKLSMDGSMKELELRKIESTTKLMSMTGFNYMEHKEFKKQPRYAPFCKYIGSNKYYYMLSIPGHAMAAIGESTFRIRFFDPNGGEVSCKTERTMHKFLRSYFAYDQKMKDFYCKQSVPDNNANLLAVKYKFGK
jgi:hypothetical protein